MDVAKIREDFPIVERKTFLNHAATSPLPRPVVETINEYMERSSTLGTASLDLEEGRRLFARLIGARPREIAIIPNTSTGLNIAANLLDYPPGANVVTTDLEYPAVVYPWLRRSLNVEVRYVRNVRGTIRLEDFEKAIDDRTVAVAISHVEYANGLRNDLKAIAQIAHEHGALIIVDAIQSVGALHLDVKGCDVDFLATSSYKWMLGPPGVGFMYIKDDLIGRFEPTFVGCAGVKPEVFETTALWNNRELILSEDARRFEVSEPGALSFVGTVTALKIILSTGIDLIERRVLKLTGRLIDELTAMGLRLQTPEKEEQRAGIVNFTVESPEDVVRMLGDADIIVSARAQGVRVSPHFYNNEEEIEVFIEALKKMLKGS